VLHTYYKIDTEFNQYKSQDSLQGEVTFLQLGYITYTTTEREHSKIYEESLYYYCNLK
jgi:hypothetical protein